MLRPICWAMVAGMRDQLCPRRVLRQSIRRRPRARDIFQQGPKALPTLIDIESAGAIAEAERAYESFDVPKGTLRGAPPVPDDDVTTLRTNLYLVAGKALGSDLVATLTQTIMSVRRDLMHEEPLFAQICEPYSKSRPSSCPKCEYVAAPNQVWRCGR
jgi:hypothetical protein